MVSPPDDDVFHYHAGLLEPGVGLVDLVEMLLALGAFPRGRG